jgi:hypothetical protein
MSKGDDEIRTSKTNKEKRFAINLHGMMSCFVGAREIPFPGLPYEWGNRYTGDICLYVA